MIKNNCGYNPSHDILVSDIQNMCVELYQLFIEFGAEDRKENWSSYIIDYIIKPLYYHIWYIVRRLLIKYLSS
jgi:hypothetical protein